MLDGSGLGVAQLKHLAAVERIRVAVAAEAAQELVGRNSSARLWELRLHRGPGAAAAASTAACSSRATLRQKTWHVHRQSAACKRITRHQSHHNVCFPGGGIRVPPSTWFQGPTRVHNPNRHLDWFGRFCSAHIVSRRTGRPHHCRAHHCVQQTHRQTNKSCTESINYRTPE